jgi:pimeloyl-ACP methyl ester carboxylesterase
MAREFSGLVLVAGGSSSGGTGGLPALVVIGSHDTMCSPATARALARRAGARYREFPGGHFAFLDEPMRDEITAWFIAREGRERGRTVFEHSGS